MKHILSFFTLLLFLLSCGSPTEKVIEKQQNIYEIQNDVVESEARLQSQIARVMELQMNDSGMMINDTGNIEIQSQIDSMQSDYTSFLEEIKKAEQRVEDMEPVSKDHTLIKLSDAFLSEYKSVAENEYNLLMQLISLPDTAYTMEKHQAYLNTTQQLNDRLDEAVRNFNDRMDEFMRRHGIEPNEPE